MKTVALLITLFSISADLMAQQNYRHSTVYDLSQADRRYIRSGSNINYYKALSGQYNNSLVYEWPRMNIDGRKLPMASAANLNVVRDAYYDGICRYVSGNSASRYLRVNNIYLVQDKAIARVSDGYNINNYEITPYTGSNYIQVIYSIECQL
jgi:hypothetical protein